MAQPFYARENSLKIGPRKGDTVYSAQPYYYGTITTKQVALQIAQESALTQADVIGVIERLAYFCRTHMSLGYKVHLEGMGVFYNRFVTTKTAETAEEVSAKLIKTIRPAFNPEYTIINHTFRYAMMPERVEVTKIDFKEAMANPGENPPSDTKDPDSSPEPDNPDAL